MIGTLVRGVAGAVLVGMVGAAVFRRLGPAPSTALPPTEDEPEALLPPPDDDHVRNSGPEAMENPPQHWDETDEESDQSFPASDPPANY